MPKVKPSPTIWALGALALGVTLFFVPVPCLFHETTGLHCPGCGSTRAVKALLAGKPLVALHDNAWLLLFALPAVALSMLAGKSSPESKFARFTARYLRVAAYAAVMFVVARNIPIAPFNYLAPLPG